MSTWQLLFDYFKRKWPRYVFGLVLVFAATWFTTRVPRLLGSAIDLLGGDAGDMREVRHTALLLAGAAFGGFAFRFTWRYMVLGFTRGAETYLRRCIFEHLEKLSADFYIKYNTGDIITRGISDVLGIRRMFGGALVSIIDATIIFTLSAANMLDTADFRMAAIAIIPIPLLLFFILRIRRNLRERQRAIRTATSAMASKVQENLTGIRIIKAFAREDGERERFESLSNARRGTEVKRVRLSAVIGPTIQLTYAVVFTLFMLYGSRLIEAGGMTVGGFTAFNGYILLMIGPIAVIGRAVEDWQAGLASIARLDDILLSNPAVEDRPGLKAEWEQRVRDGKDPFAPRYQSADDTWISVKNLTFAYSTAPKDAPPVLNDVSFDVKRGETLAITGPIGCGKSTLMNLLSRLWQITPGSAKVGGLDVQNIPVSVLRGATGFVPQDNFLFSDSILENIRFYADDVTDDDVYDAARAVSVDSDIREFAQGYDTVVGERGVTLSGGQMQRVAIARALVRRPQLLLLDDCLSAVDAETERAIIGGLRGYLEGATAIIVTHRVAAASLADRIMVLSPDGRVAEIGTYDELVANHGEFYSLVEMQTGA